MKLFICSRKLLLELEVSTLKANNENLANKVQELNKQITTERGLQKQKESLARFRMTLNNYLLSIFNFVSVH